MMSPGTHPKGNPLNGEINIREPNKKEMAFIPLPLPLSQPWSK